MLDIIIPCYNAKDTLWRTLFSIAVQKEFNQFKVYLVNDCSVYDYQEFVAYFSSFFSIEEIKLENNVGPGGARSEGIKRSNGRYIMFIDSDDILYSIFAIKNLMNYILDRNSDLLISHFIYERDGEREVKKNNFVWLHGKVYKREFLERYCIDFNDTRANEDNGFNRLVLLMKPHIDFLDDITYVYCENPDSITRKNNRAYKLAGLEGFVYNMNWAIQEGLKRSADVASVSEIVLGTLVAMYYYYLELYDDYDVSCILRWCVNMRKLYLLYSDLYSEEVIFNMLEVKEMEYRERGISFDGKLSFSSFLDKVGENND